VAQNVGYFCNVHATAPSKHSPIGRKIAQSGHPGDTVKAQGTYVHSNVELKYAESQNVVWYWLCRIHLERFANRNIISSTL
jgi:hypothetical protein